MNNLKANMIMQLYNLYKNNKDNSKNVYNIKISLEIISNAINDELEDLERQKIILNGLLKDIEEFNKEMEANKNE